MNVKPGQIWITKSGHRAVIMDIMPHAQLYHICLGIVGDEYNTIFSDGKISPDQARKMGVKFSFWINSKGKDIDNVDRRYSLVKEIKPYKIRFGE